MADKFTSLADMIVPEVFANYVMNLSTKTNRLIQSGILTNDPSLGGQLLAPGDLGLILKISLLKVLALVSNLLSSSVKQRHSVTLIFLHLYLAHQYNK